MCLNRVKIYCKCPSLFICMTKDDPPPRLVSTPLPPRQPVPSTARGRMEQRGRRKCRAIPPPPYPPSTMHSPMTCAHPAPSSSSPLMVQPAVFVGVISHHLGLTSPHRLRCLLRFLPRAPPSCVIVSSVVVPNPDDDYAAANDDDDDDTVSVASTAMADVACGSLPP